MAIKIPSANIIAANISDVLPSLKGNVIKLRKID